MLGDLLFRSFGNSEVKMKEGKDWLASERVLRHEKDEGRLGDGLERGEVFFSSVYGIASGKTEGRGSFVA